VKLAIDSPLLQVGCSGVPDALILSMLSGKRQENLSFLRQNSNFIYALATTINMGKCPENDPLWHCQN
jgi:hypothetical protein